MNASLTVDLDLRVRLTQKIEMPAYFTALGSESPLAGRQREIYADLDLYEWGFEEEHQRPIAWLLSLAHQEATPFNLVAGLGAHVVDGDVEDSEASVEGRHGPARDGTGRHWAQTDFYTLADQVDWVAEVYLARLDADPTSERTERDQVLAARLASRTDTPLFEMEASA